MPTDEERDAASPARELTRRRARRSASDDTGRHHHLGAAPTTQPVHGTDGVGSTGTAPVQLSVRTTAHLTTQRAELAGRMARAAADLDFEVAATLRDEILAIDAELARRDG